MSEVDHAKRQQSPVINQNDKTQFLYISFSNFWLKKGSYLKITNKPLFILYR